MIKNKIKIYSLLFLGIIVIGVGGFIIGFSTDVTWKSLAFDYDNFNNCIVNNISMKLSKIDNNLVSTDKNIVLEFIEMTNNSLETIIAIKNDQLISVSSNNSSQLSANMYNSSDTQNISEEKNNSEDISQNPSTGISFSVGELLVIIICSIITLKKKNLFYNI